MRNDLKPAKFKYIAPTSPEDVINHLTKYQGEARCLSGGQSLLPLMSYRLVRPAALIDLNRSPGLNYIDVETCYLAIGPTTTQAAAEHSADVRRHCPLICQALRFAGSPTIRNRGTIGGTLAHADRTAEMPAVAVALGATIVAQGPAGRRLIAAEDFFLGDLTTALQPDEMLREVQFPLSNEKRASAFVEASNRHHDLALVGIAIQLTLKERGIVREARIVCIGVGPRPIRLQQVEHALCTTDGSLDSIMNAADLSLQGIEIEGDIHASADYRSAILPGLVARALKQAMTDRGDD